MSTGRYQVWDDRGNHPTYPVRDVPVRPSEDQGHHIHVYLDGLVPPPGTARVSRRDNAGDPGEEMPARRNGNPNGPSGAQPRMLADGHTCD